MLNITVIRDSQRVKGGFWCGNMGENGHFREVHNWYIIIKGGTKFSDRVQKIYNSYNSFEILHN